MRFSIYSLILKKRAEFEKFISSRTVPPQATEGVIEHRDLIYFNDNDPGHKLDIFCPRTATTPLPVIINLHGGGLIMGNKEFNRHFCLRLCQMGFLVFSVDYPLCPESTVFEQLQDVYMAMDYIDGLLPQFHAQPGGVYMVGDSAGAFLALYAAAIQRNPKLKLASLRHPSHVEIKSLALISGMFYTTRRDRIGLFLQETFYGQEPKSHPFYRYLNPDDPEVSMFLPPCLLITSKADNLRRYTTDLARTLRRNRSPFILRDYGKSPELKHAFSVFDPEIPESQQVIEEIASFFRDYE